MDPIQVAVIGAGRRAVGVYFNILPKLAASFKVVALCDRDPEAAAAAAEHLGVASFRSLRELASARPMEAAIVLTPVESHHAISVFLSRNRIHHLCETPMALTLGQCRQMASAAEKDRVVLRVNDQFPLLPLIAFTREIIDAGVIGPVGRITYYHGHTGYHNNSIWQAYGGMPTAVNAVAHSMGVCRHLDGAGRWQDRETFRLRVLHFAGGLLGVDMAGNIKSALGRCPRPGYLEIDGTAGAIVAQPYDSTPAPWTGRAEVRLVAEEDYQHGAYAESYPIQRITRVGHRTNISDRLPHGEDYLKLRCRLPDRMLEYANPMLEYGIAEGYLSAVAQGLMDFYRQVREGAAAGFSVPMAVASSEMEAAFAHSARLGGARVGLPFDGEDQAEQATLASLRERYGVDPMDVDAMIDVAFPRNYVPEALTEQDDYRGKGR